MTLTSTSQSEQTASAIAATQRGIAECVGLSSPLTPRGPSTSIHAKNMAWTPLMKCRIGRLRISGFDSGFTRDALAAAGRRSRSLFDVSAVQPGLLERRAVYRSGSG